MQHPNWRDSLTDLKEWGASRSVPNTVWCGLLPTLELFLALFWQVSPLMNANIYYFIVRGVHSFDVVNTYCWLTITTAELVEMPLELYWQSPPLDEHVEQTGLLPSHFVLRVLQLKHATGTRSLLRLTRCEMTPFWGDMEGCPRISG
jgi:hypothetical protein